MNDPNTIELSLGDFTTLKIDRFSNGDEHVTPMDSTTFVELLERGWQIVHKGKDKDRLRVILRRPGKGKHNG